MNQWSSLNIDEVGVVMQYWNVFMGWIQLFDINTCLRNEWNRVENNRLWEILIILNRKIIYQLIKMVSYPNKPDFNNP